MTADQVNDIAFSKDNTLFFRTGGFTGENHVEVSVAAPCCSTGHVLCFHQNLPSLRRLSGCVRHCLHAPAHTDMLSGVRMALAGAAACPQGTHHVAVLHLRQSQ